MPVPTQSSLELYLLHEIDAMGGVIDYRLQKKELLSRLAKWFPKMTEQEALDPTPKMKVPRFQNNVEWTRNALVNKRGFLEHTTVGQWGPLSSAGQQYLANNWPPSQPPIYAPVNDTVHVSPESLPEVPDPNSAVTLAQLIAANRQETKRLLKERILDLSPWAFEDLVGLVLSYTGFSEVEITSRTNDGGIDGFCKQPFLGLVIPFQAKRYKIDNLVNGEVVAAFRGRIVGKYLRGIFITTSSFTPGGREAGQSDIELVDGDRFIDFMLDNKIGIHDEAVMYASLDEDFFLKFKS